MGSIDKSFWVARTHFFLVFAVAATIVTAHPADAQSGITKAESQEQSINRASSVPSFHIGAFFTGGFVPSYWVHGGAVSRSVELNLFNAGLSAGKIITSVHGPGLLRGRGEAAFELMPFWLGDYPKQTQSYCMPGEGCAKTQWGPYRRFGMSVTPFLFRWDFVGRGTHRVLPWVQLGGGLLWTNHKFPLLGGDTSVINFTPQVGVGESFFTRRNQSIDVALKAVHISNAGLADDDPGLNITLQFSVGYSWWR